MWIAHSNGWLSIVEHRDKPEALLVRARKRSHITSLWDDADIYVLDDADYPYRADIDRSVVADTLALEIITIDYDNFKNSVTEAKLYRAFTDVWATMYEYGWNER